MAKQCSIDGCSNRHEARGWCQMHYKRWRKNGDPLAGATTYADPDEAFAARTEQRGDCLIWTGSHTTNGYGNLGVNGRVTYAHRYAWERENGPIPGGLEVDHLCWVRDCVNLAHLRVVTHAENMRNLSGVRKSRLVQIP